MEKREEYNARQQLPADIPANIAYALIEAEEKNNRWLASELRDKASQQLSLCASEIEYLKESLPLSLVDIQSRIDKLSRDAQKTLDCVREVTHELSPMLDYLSTAGVMRTFCGEFAEELNLNIQFAADGVPENLPGEISICLFRVLQEALHNMVEHSGVKSAEVKLHGSPNQIYLSIQDSGVGFDPAATKEKGFGLISMRERVRLVGGTIGITSKPKSGTQVRVHVPLSTGISPS